MTTAASSIKSLALPSLPRAPSPSLSLDQEAEANRIQADTLVEANRRATPAGVTDKRATPRMSISELNRLTWDDVRERYEALPHPSGRSTFVKILDLIDMPRNAMGNLIATTIAPSAKRRATDRGEVDQLGMPKVYFSDILRSMGVSNGIVAGVVGFAGDVITDPLSWVGGPLGVAGSGLKRGGFKATVGASGRKFLNRSLKEYEKGGLEAVTHASTKKYFGEILAEPELAAALKSGKVRMSDIIIGTEKQGIGAVVDKATLSKQGTEGLLATGAIKSKRGGQKLYAGQAGPVHPTAISRAELATKEWLNANQLNRGLKIGGERATAAIAHIPFNDRTLYVPAFGPFGQKARAQRAITMASAGKNGPAKLLLDINAKYQESEDLLAEVAVLSQRRREFNEGTRAGEDLAIGPTAIEVPKPQKVKAASKPKGKGAYTLRPGAIENEDNPAWRNFVAEFMDDEVEALKNKATQVRAELDGLLKQAHNGGVLHQIDDIGDLLSAREAYNEVVQKWELAQGLSVWRNTGLPVFASVPTNLDVSKAKAQLGAAKQVFGIKATEFVDDLMPGDIRRRQILEFQRSVGEATKSRISWLQRSGEADLENFEKVADSYHKLLENAADYANTTRDSLLNVLNNTDREAYELTRAAQMLLGADSALPFAPLVHAAEKVGGGRLGSEMASLAMAIGRSFGGEHGSSSTMARVLHGHLVTGGRAKATQLVQDYYKGNASRYFIEMPDGSKKARGLFAIAKHNLGKGWKNSLPTLDAMVTALAWAKAGNTEVLWKEAAKGSSRVPERITEWLNVAKQKGFLENESLMAELDRMATQSLDLFTEIGETALIERHIDALLSGAEYIPVSATSEAAAAIKTAFSSSRNPTVRGAADDAFKEARGSYLIKFNQKAKDAEGNIVEIPREFLEWERRILGGLTDADVDDVATEIASGAGKDVAEYFVGQVEAVKQFNKMIEEAGGSIMPSGKKLTDADAVRSAMIHAYGKPLDPFTLPSRIQQSSLVSMTGRELIGDMFDLSMSNAIARRGASAAIESTKRAFIEGVIMPHTLQARKIGKGSLAELGSRTGAKIRTRNGLEMEVLPPSSNLNQTGRMRLKVGDTVYTRLPDPPEGVDIDLTDFLNVSESGAYDFLVPEGLAVSIGRFYEGMEGANPSKWLKLANQAVGLWKTTTLAHPSWAVVNSIGNAFLIAMAHAHQMHKMPHYLSQAIKIVNARRTPEELDKIILDIGGRKISARHLLEITDEQSITTGGGKAAEALQHYIKTIGDPSVSNRMAGSFKNRYAQSIAEGAAFRKAGEAQNPVQKGVQQIRASAIALNSRTLGRYINAWYAVNGGIDDSFRLASMIAHMDDLQDPYMAAHNTRRAMLDFSDMTKFEGETMRMLFPFYAWIRASLPNMMHKLFNEPRYFGAIPKLQNALEEAMAGEDAMPLHHRPTWMQQQLAFQIGRDPETAKMFMTGTILPHEQALQTVAGAAGVAGMLGEALTPFDFSVDGKDVMESMDFGVSQSNFIFQSIFDLARGQEGFTGRKIGPDAESGDIGIWEYILGKARPLREFGVGAPGPGPIQRSFAEGPVEGLARMTVGGRMQAGDTEKVQFSLAREMSEQEQYIRRAVRKAERDGRGDDSTRARVKLLGLYRYYLERGLDESYIPVWAREQLAELGGSIEPQVGIMVAQEFSDE